MDSAPVTPPYVAGPLRMTPFRAIRLVPSRVGDPGAARVFARPFRDVTSRLVSWERRGRLERDAEPALYLHEYTVSGITVRGLVGAVDVSRRAVQLEDRAILPHEGIYPAQADDLADRMETMRINPAPILLVQNSPPPLRALLQRTRETSGPDHQLTDRGGHLHRVWTIRNTDVAQTIAHYLAPTTALIADGHHRYAAYLRLQQRQPGGPADHGLAMLVDNDDTPLFLGAIHRVLVGTTIDDVSSAAAALGIPVRRRSRDEAVSALAPGTLVATDTDTWLTLALTASTDLVEAEVLHDQLVPALGHGPSRVTYHHAAREALEHVGAGRGAAVLMPAPSFDQVARVVTAGRLYPEKATSFQPKPAFGMFIRSWSDEVPAPSPPPPRPGTSSPRPS